MNRRHFLSGFGLGAAVLAAPALSAAEPPAGPWKADELMQTAALAALLKNHGAKQPVILCVGFPVLYRQRHILGATLAGPAAKPEGIADLKKSVAALPKGNEIVIYCGCCPMVHCPNIRPAYSTLKEMGFTNIRVLDIPANFHTDWDVPGYPVS